MASVSNLQPPRFSGTDSANVNMWLRLFEDFSNDSGWDGAKQASKIKLLLTGEAQIFVWDLDDTKQASYKGIKAELVKFYSSKETSYAIMAQFEDRKRAAGESWRQLCYSLKLLYMEAYPGHGKPIRDSAVKHRLLRLMETNVREAILKTENVESFTPEALADRASNLEKISNCATATVAGNSTDSMEKRLDKMQQDLEELVARIGNSTRPDTSQGRRRRGRCYNCGAAGHFAASCFKKQSSKNQSSASITCFRCSGKGHRANVCPTKTSGNF